MSLFLYWHYCEPKVPQAAKAVSGGQDTLVDLFGRIENFFTRLEAYIHIPPTVGMVDMIVKIMVQVLSILSIATKAFQQNRTSELFPDDIPFPSVYHSTERFLTNLVGRTDVEDALQKLDKLTQDEARTAIAEGLKATHGVDDKVEGLRGKVTGISDQVQDVQDSVKGVDCRVREVGDKIIGGERITLNLSAMSSERFL